MGYFYMNGKQYEILAEINRQQRNKPDRPQVDLRAQRRAGEMIQLDNLITLAEKPSRRRSSITTTVFVSATVSAGLAEGEDHRAGARRNGPHRRARRSTTTFRTALAGDSKEFRESSSSLMFAFLLAIVLIYLILAAQFESFKDPLVIMLTVPLAMAGALVFMYAGNGQTMNIFSQIGIIMLIGLVAKNGILIVEFANQKQDAGLNKREAIEQASLQRLRPILMTSASTILGLLPLTMASGEGAQGRIAMGVAVVGGMVRFDAADPLYRAGDLQLRLDRPDPKNEKEREMKRLILTVLAAGAVGAAAAQECGEPMTLQRCLELGLEQQLRCPHHHATSSASATTTRRRPTPGCCRRVDLTAGYSGALDNEPHDSARGGRL